MDSKSKSKNNIGILLIGHGSTLHFASEVFNKIAEKFKKISDYPVEIGYMEFSKPSISQAVSRLKLKSINKIIVMPILLAEGIHSLIDIPIILGMQNKIVDPRVPDGNYPEKHYLNNIDRIDFDGEIVLLDCIGPDPLILKILRNKVDTAFKNLSKLTKDNTGVIFISHGSRLKYNSEFLTELLRMFKDETDYKATLGFMEITNPNIPTAINDFLKDNDFKNLIAVPVFIAPGMHTKRDIPKILKLQTEIESKNHHQNHSGNNHSYVHHSGSYHAYVHHSGSHNHTKEDIGMEFDGNIIYLDPIGSDDLIIEIIKQRIDKQLNK
jgi:sirohydrochlorin cobaltochelatase